MPQLETHLRLPEMPALNFRESPSKPDR